MQRVQSIKFVKVVNNYVMHVGINGHTQFVHALVIAVHDATAAWHASVECNEQLAACCDVEH